MADCPHPGCPEQTYRLENPDRIRHGENPEHVFLLTPGLNPVLEAFNVYRFICLGCHPEDEDGGDCDCLPDAIASLAELILELPTKVALLMLDDAGVIAESEIRAVLGRSRG